jgi:hypothetical protein
MHRRPTIVTAASALCVWAGLTATAAGQGTPDPKASPLEAATAPKSDAPATIEPGAPALDPDIEAVIGLLAGSFESAASATVGETPALRFNAAPISVTGLGNAVYFEFSRADSPGEAFRQGVLHAYRFRDELRLRVLDFTGSAGLKDTLVGLWAAPEALPKLTFAALDPNLDLVLTPTRTEGSFRGQTPHPYPTGRDGAVEMTAQIALGGDRLSFSDTGVGADGQAVWGSGTPAVFTRAAAPPFSVVRTEEGLTIITLVAPPADAPKLVENGTIAVHYSGWLTDGTRFDSSRMPGRQPFQSRIPGGVIRGWNEGLKGMAKGERRRLVIPPEMGYGKRGFQRVIPPDAVLIFEIECVHVDNTLPPEAQPPGGLTPPPAPAPPAPAPNNGPAPTKPAGGH